MKKSFFNRLGKFGAILVLLLSFAFGPLAGCSNNPLNPKDPVTITVWHYYAGAIENAFNAMVQEFNETIGKQRGVIVESLSRGSTAELEKAVMASAKNEVGSEAMPNIFAAYADTAYAIEKMGLLADVGEYFTKKEQADYLDSYIEEGKIGLNGELRIFPIAKSTEIFMLNDTDWAPFAQAYGYTYEDLGTYEGLAAVSADYYAWTDAQTPDVSNDGKAFYGRDSMANFFIISSKEFNKEIFQVSDGKGTLNVDSTTMKKLWDYYYVPYISGHFYASGRFRSDNAKTGEVLSYIGSTASANYTPTEVTINGEKHAIEVKVLPVPHFLGGAKVQVQQGGGMVVTKTDVKHEYASVLFLKWFTDVSNNSVFSAMNGYLPVKKAANNYNSMISIIQEKGLSISPIADETLKVSFSAIQSGTLYTNKAFDGGTTARNILDAHMQAKANADREAVIALIASGLTHAQAVAQFNTTQNFNAWLNDFIAALQAAIAGN